MKISAFPMLAATAVSVLLCGQVAAQTPNRVVDSIDESHVVTLRGNVHPLVQARWDRGPAPADTPTGRIMLVLRRSGTQQQALSQYLADLQNPSSSNYHRWLTPAEFGARFGISSSDLQTVESWLQSQGFKIEKAPQGRNVIEFSGNFGLIERAFHASMHTFFVQGEKHFANISDPQIPAALAPVVAGVGPLNDFHPKAPLIYGPRGQFNAATGRIEPAFTLPINGTPYLFVVPADAATIYDTPNTALNANYSSGTTYDGAGVSIGIGGISDLTVGDIENYRTAFLGETTADANLPTVVVEGDDPGLVSGWAGEAVLDNEVSGGLAPKAKIYFYTSADTDLASGMFTAIYRALDDDIVSILSLSVQSCEAEMGNTGNQEVLEASEQAAAQGITVVVAAGDSGSAGCDNFDTATAAQNGFAVNGFASSPWVVAVGGTDFDGLPKSFGTYANSAGASSYGGSAPYYRTALQYIPENPWNDSTSLNGTYQNNQSVASGGGSSNIVAGSGGVSSCAAQDAGGACTGGYAKPPFQVGPTPSDGVRDVPDVSFLAANGQYQALWLFCSDSVTDGSSQSYLDCVNTNGQFSGSTYFSGVGGTSASAPAFAGMLALVAEAEGSASDNYRLGQANFILYQLAQSNYSAVFHDVKTGNNSVSCESGSPNCGSNDFMLGYNAGANYDLASGLGSVDVQALINHWSSAKLASTSTSITLDGSTAAYTGTHGSAVTFNVGVTPAAANGVAAIVDNANENGTTPPYTPGPLNNGQVPVALSSGTGQVTWNGLPGGSYTVWARYGGDVSHAASSSAPISVTIGPEASTTTLAISAYNPQTGAPVSLSNIPYGSAMYADATIAGKAEGSGTQGVATGYVNFNNGNSMNYSGIGVSYVADDNVATWAPRGPEAVYPSSYSVFADYLGDASYNPSTSNSMSFTVVRAQTGVVASANPENLSSGSVTITASVETPWNLAGPPTGNVSFSLGGTVLQQTTLLSTDATVQVSGGTAEYVQTATASVSSSALAAGSDTFTINYSGDEGYVASSGTVAVSVTSAFQLSNGGDISVAAGATSGNTSNIVVTPAGGFTGAVDLACKVNTSIASPNDPPTCSVPASVTVSDTSQVLATLTVTTTAPVTTGALSHPLEKFFAGGGFTLAIVLFVGIPARRRAWRGAVSFAALMFVAGVLGCGGGGGGGGGPHTIPGTTPGTYSVTVTGKDAATGQLTSSTTVTLTVQ